MAGVERLKYLVKDDIKLKFPIEMTGQQGIFLLNVVNSASQSLVIDPNIIQQTKHLVKDMFLIIPLLDIRIYLFLFDQDNPMTDVDVPSVPDVVGKLLQLLFVVNCHELVKKEVVLLFHARDWQPQFETLGRVLIAIG